MEVILLKMKKDKVMVKIDEIADKDESAKMKTVRAARKRERAKEPKDKIHYKIFRVEKDPKTGAETKITMTTFWAKDDKEAYEELKKYRKAANKAYRYYFGTAGYYVGNELDASGKVKRYDDYKEMMKDWLAVKTACEKISDIVLSPFERVWDKMRDGWWWLCDLCFFIKNKHKRNESWSLDYHIVDDIIFNIPLLIKNKSGVPTEFCMKARIELHKAEKNFDVDKSFEKEPGSSDKELELAEKMWNEELEKGLLYAKLYTFYHELGILEKNAWPDSEKFEKEWAKTIPYVPGTYDRIDYVKLHSLENKYWNSLWNWIKDNGRNLWD